MKRTPRVPPPKVVEFVEQTARVLVHLSQYGRAANRLIASLRRMEEIYQALPAAERREITRAGVRKTAEICRNFQELGKKLEQAGSFRRPPRKKAKR